MSVVAKVVQFIAYKNPIIPGYDYATISISNNRELPLDKYYSKDKLPKKYKDLMNKRNPDESSNFVDRWYL